MFLLEIKKKTPSFPEVHSVYRPNPEQEKYRAWKDKKWEDWKENHPEVMQAVALYFKKMRE